VQRIANYIPELEVEGDPEGDLLVLGWGSTRGAILTAVEQARKQGVQVSNAHLRYLNPFPENVGEVLGRFRRVIVPEINLGQLRMLLRARFLIDALGINEVRGKMFHVDDLVAKTLALMNDPDKAAEGGRA